MDIAILAALIVLIALVVAVAALQIMRRGGAPSSEQFLTLAEERFKRQTETNTNELDNKKQLIDQRLEQMNQALERVTTLVNNVERDREAKFSELGVQLKMMAEQATALTNSTNRLGEALSNTRVRGQWGERMADDILQLHGTERGISIMKRQKSQLDGAGSRPDFSFFLPERPPAQHGREVPLGQLPAISECGHGW